MPLIVDCVRIAILGMATPLQPCEVHQISKASFCLAVDCPRRLEDTDDLKYSVYMVLRALEGSQRHEVPAGKLVRDTRS